MREPFNTVGWDRQPRKKWRTLPLRSSLSHVSWLLYKSLRIEKYISFRMKWFFWPPFLSVSPFSLLNLARRQSYAYAIGLYTKPEIKSWPDIKFCAHAHCVLPRGFGLLYLDWRAKFRWFPVTRDLEIWKILLPPQSFDQSTTLHDSNEKQYRLFLF